MIEKRDISLVTGAILMAAAAAILLMVLLNGPAPAHASLVAATRHVAITGDDEGGSNTCTSVVTPCRTVQHAVDVATGGDEILVATGVYTANGQAQVIYVDETVSIRGGYTTTDWTCNPISFPTTLDAEGQGRVVFIAGNVTSTLEGLRITSGAVNGNGGGIYVGDAHLVLSDCQVVSNVAGTTGGGIALYGSSNLRLTANSIVSNTAIRGNGGGVFLSNSPDATLAGNEIYGNTAITADGGGIYLDSSPNATLTSNNVYSNTAKRSGGGIGLRESAPAALTANRAYSNVAGANGGGVYIDDSDGTTLTANRLYSNTAQDYGGGVYLFSSLTPTLGGNEIYGNRAITWSGGGIALHSCHNARLVSNEVYSNTAKYGGGIGFTNCDDVELTGNNIHDDTAAHGGGGIYLHNSDSATLINNMLVENQLAVSGGGAGILVVNSQARMLHTTLARNGGAEGSGVRLEKYSAFASVVAMTNTILVSHTVGVVAYGGTTATLEATLWGDGAWANVTDTMHNVFTGTLNYPSNPAFVDPDGGDYHIAWGSAARDAGVEAGVSDDVDGEPRPLGGGPDLGADEYGCCVRLEANPAVYYPTAQAAIDASAHVTDVVQVAGACRGVQTCGSDRQAARITKTLTLRGGYGPGWVWDPDNYPATLDAQGQGRVIYISGHITPTVDSLTLTGGNGSHAGADAGRGGGIYCSQADALIADNVITNNVANTSTTAYGYGGGVYLWQSGAVISGNTIVSNVASTAYEGHGGGLLANHGSATIRGNTIAGNTAGADPNSRGGGIHLEYSPAAVSGNTIRGNTGAYGGGGLRLFYSDATVDGNVIVSNTSTWGGGGLKAENCTQFTVTNNVVAQNGGTSAVFVWASPGPSHGTLVNNTIAQNSDCGVYLSQYTTLTLTNNVVASQTIGISARPGFTNSAIADYTLFYGNTDDTNGSVITSTHEITGSDPLFVDPTGWDYHLRAGSPAIDAGHPTGVPPAPPTDVDGEPRPADGDLDGSAVVDLGADEFAQRRVYLPLVLKN